MGGVRTFPFHMSEEEQRRFAKAQERLDRLGGALPVVNVGETIQADEEAAFLRGHGTQLVDGKLVATVCGIVERVNKLISVRPLRARYNPGTGDVVVGRITEVAPKRWKVDVNSKQDAQLMLSAVNLPGGLQRRRTADDELNMRNFFEERDLISAEVQAVHQDGSIHLHTRSLKYGKLEKGQLTQVAPYLVKRLNHHFYQLKQFGLEIIFACNGYIWISGPSEIPDKKGASSELLVNVSNVNEMHQCTGNKESTVPTEKREKICRCANALRVLNALGLLIYPESIIDTYEASLMWGTDIKDMLSGEFHVKVLEREVSKRSKSV
ncbi:hypothetical protein O6H91_18G031000 [Diphasiastrum complanatum]|uniref:Uncharacterized protein n=1 Tax=Diphasiastrum complanatum TaxID=34168 RepID=A0ACC2AZG2_DIPCM|nr:hypothetical protein O6H91_18G031000 [Diphasiastrum complanatum]